LNRTLRELRSYYETFLFTVKNHELKYMDECYESRGEEVNIAYGDQRNEQSSCDRYMHPSKLQQIMSDSRRTLALQLKNPTKGSQENNRVKKARQFLKIIDLTSKISKADELIWLLCPFCSKPVSCGNHSP